MNQDLSFLDAPLCLAEGKTSDRLWIEVIHRLTTPAPNETEFERFQRKGMYLYIAEFVRLQWDSKFRLLSVRGSDRKCLELHGLFLQSLFDLLTAWHGFRPGLRHPAILFGVILFELEIVPSFIVKPIGSEPVGKARSLCRNQKANKQLLIRENPFLLPHTRVLFDELISDVCRSDQFAKLKYTPFVKMRMTLTVFLKAEGIGFTNKDGKPSRGRQGRRKLKS